MAQNKRTAAQVAARRRQVARLYVHRVTQDQIAQQLGVSQSTISRDIKALLKAWRQAALRDVAEHLARELAELDVMEQQCATRFAETRQREWLTERRQIKQLRAQLLGLNAPQQAHTVSQIRVIYDDCSAGSPDGET